MTRGDTSGSNDETSITNRRLNEGLALLVGWKAPRFEEFLAAVGSPVEWWASGEPDFDGDFDFLTDSQCGDLEELYECEAGAVASRVEDWSGRVVVVGDPEYPDRLGDLRKPPSALHVLGDVSVLETPGLAVVGSRDIGVSAASAARRILEPALERGLTVTSGGALGSDAVAHRAAVATGGTTMVVLPSGLHDPSPKSHRRLFRDVVDAGGLVVSEYPPDQGVRHYHFRRRNSLIAATSRGVLALRAGSDSGTMLTVQAARRLDRPRGAMPGDPDDPLCAGCHEIIRRGGRLVARPEDVFSWWEALAPASLEESDQQQNGATTDETSRPDCEVLDRAAEIVDGDGAFSIEALARETGKSASELQTVLLEHELSGIVERAAGGGRFRFRRGLE